MNWQTVEIPYDVYLEAGPHTLRLEATVGVLSDLVADVEEAVRQLNYAYRRIVMITGTSPDTYRDYQLPENIPEVFRVFEEQIAVLQNCDRELVEKTGKRGSMNAVSYTHLGIGAGSAGFPRPENMPPHSIDPQGCSGGQYRG